MTTMLDSHLILEVLFYVCFLSLLVVWGLLLSSNFDLIGGWPGVFTCFAVLLGVRHFFVRHREEKRRQLMEEVISWMSNEVDHVYKGKRDTSGSIFKTYACLYSNSAKLEGHILDELSFKATCVEKSRPFRAHAYPEWLHAIDIDMTFNSNAIEGNPITYRETTIILSRGLSVGGGRSRGTS
jgi:hypothetical protein